MMLLSTINYNRLAIPFVLFFVGSTVVFALCAKIRKRQFVKMEVRRHVERIKLSLHQLVAGSNKSWAYANLAWSQAELMAIATKYLTNNDHKKRIGTTYALALNVPLEHAKRVVFTECPRMIENSMPVDTAEKLL
jgi:hypothetical protein